MSKWTDLALAFLESDPSANSANSANSPQSAPIGTNGTIGTGVKPEKTPRPDRLMALERLAALEPCSEAEAVFIQGLEALGWSRGELVEILNTDTMRRFPAGGLNELDGKPPFELEA